MNTGMNINRILQLADWSLWRAFRIVACFCLLTSAFCLNPMSIFAAANVSPEQIDALLADYAKPDGPGAAVMVIKDGKVVYAKAFGLANLEDHTPCTTSTNFRLASFTKQFTAMAIMMLVERGQLSLDSRLTEIIPEFPAYGREIKVRNLLNHTSGLLDYENLITTGTTIPVLDRDALWLLEQQAKTNFVPGTQFAYSNSGYAVLAVIVERVSGQTFASFMRHNIFEPLAMKNSLINERGISAISNRAYGYSHDPATSGSTGAGSKWKRTDQSMTSYVQGDGGIYSSVSDLYSWDQALYTTRLVSRATLDQIFAPGSVETSAAATTSSQSATTPKAHYGFGWYIDQYRGKKLLRHNGGTTGFSTVIERYPDDQFTVIMLTNRSNADRAMTQRIADLYLFGTSADK